MDEDYVELATKMKEQGNTYFKMGKKWLENAHGFYNRGKGSDDESLPSF